MTDTSMITIYQMLLGILDVHFGIIIFDDGQDDFSINEYILNSLDFIKFIIAIENELDTELSDDFLTIDLMMSAKGFAEKISFFLTSSLESNVSIDDNSRQIDLL